MGKGLKSRSAIIPRAYILSHCDFTANLTLTILNVINFDQLKGLYNNDDVVAESKKVKETMFLNVHYFVNGPNLSLDLAAEFRYHIFSKELPLVLKTVLHGDSALFDEHPELMDALVCMYFHSALPKYKRNECWGSLKDAAEGKPGDHVQGQQAGFLATFSCNKSQPKTSG
ncbi:Protein STAY-GREEN LIKE [Hibiscus syriacus]|uniref:Protein STAY-GREEN LIKE n=1 Tax=Hibiscus syriacus TaxID=106335 RepID=A0A6A2Z2K1_HIBSY|nr:Protein STAY-GREEN LIKE [Hibiscus syriacus]